MKPKSIIKAVALGSALTFASTTAAMAEIPGNSVILGSKAYDVKLLFSNDYTQQINSDLAVSNGILYFNLGNGWKDIMSGEEISYEEMAQLPQVTYLNKDGVPTVYAEGNGDPVAEVTVDSVSAINGTVTVTFAEAVTEVPEGLVVLKDGIALDLAADQFVVADGKVVITVPTVEATAVDQTIVYSVKLGDAEAVVAVEPVVVAADAELAAQAVAETAVTAYEGATISKYDDVAAAATLKTEADSAVAAVTDAAAKAAFALRVTNQTDAINAIKTAKVKAVNDATNQPALLTALGFFNGVDTNLILDYDTKFGGAVVNTTVELIQTGIYDSNLAAKMNLAITGTILPGTVDQLKLQSALQYGVDIKVLTNVDFIKYFDAYVATAAAYTARGQFDTAAEIQTSMIDTAIAGAATGATNAVINAEATPNADLIAAAQTLVDALDDDVAPTTTKADLNARLEAIRPVAPVLAAKASGVQSLLLTSLQSSAYSRVNADLIVQYMAGIVGTDITVPMIQAKIDAANLTATNTAVTAAEATLLTTAKLATAQALVTALPADVAPATTKADLQTRLDVVNALLAVDSAATANSATVLSALQTNATALGLTGASAINAPYADFYKTALYAGAQTTRDTAGKVQALISGVNAARATAAETAVTDAEATLLTAAKVAIAQPLVTAMPDDIAPATTKADLQTRIDVVNALLALDTAVTATGSTDASVLEALQANATVLGLTGAHAVNPALAYKAALAGAQTVRDTKAKVIAIVDTVNSPTAGLTALETPGANADDELALLQDLTLNLTGVLEANKDAYFADATALATAAGTSVAAVQDVVDAINALVQLNAATTSASAKSALTTFTLNVTHASSVTYQNLNSTAKLELAGLMVADIAENGAYADIAAVQAAIVAQNTARTDLIAAVNDACDTTLTILAVKSALAGLGYAPFDNLSATEQIDVAEAFLNAYPQTSAPAPVANYYTSITAIEADIDAAIAAQ